MKKFISLIMVAVLAVMLVGCNKYDDSDLQRRVSALESLSTYQDLLQKLNAGQTVTAYTQSGSDYVFTFSDGSKVTIKQEETLESPIKDISTDGNTLTITLADGTVVPVVYGEKEPFGITVGENGRKYYTFFEDKNAELHQELVIPYSLTGDLNSIDDVTIIPNVTVLGRADATLLDAVSVNPVDAKSGNIVVRQLDGTYDNTGEEYTRTYPPYKVDFMAYFPDGSTRVKTIEILGETIRLSSNYLTFNPLDANQLEFDEPVPVSGLSGYVYIEVWIGPHFSLYDGPGFPNWNFSDLFEHQLSPTFGTITPTETPTLFPVDLGYNDGGYQAFHYDIELNINRNTRPINNYITMSFYRKGLTPEGGKKSIYLTNLRFTQEHE